MDERRRFLFHGFAILTVAFALGLVAAVTGMHHDPRARLWLGAHLTGILTGLLVTLLGLARPHLDLGPRGARAFFWTAVGGNWLGMLVLGIFNSALGSGTAIVTPQLAAAQGWQGAVIGGTIFIVTVTTFGFCGLGLYGLRARAPVDAANLVGRERLP
jgi:hypothetical protein